MFKAFEIINGFSSAVHSSWLQRHSFCSLSGAKIYTPKLTGQKQKSLQDLIKQPTNDNQLTD